MKEQKAIILAILAILAFAPLVVGFWIWVVTSILQLFGFGFQVDSLSRFGAPLFMIGIPIALIGGVILQIISQWDEYGEVRLKLAELFLWLEVIKVLNHVKNILTGELSFKTFTVSALALISPVVAVAPLIFYLVAYRRYKKGHQLSEKAKKVASLSGKVFPMIYLLMIPINLLVGLIGLTLLAVVTTYAGFYYTKRTRHAFEDKG